MKRAISLFHLLPRVEQKMFAPFGKVAHFYQICRIALIVVAIVSVGATFPTFSFAQESGRVNGVVTLPSTVATLTGTLVGIQIRLVSQTDATVITTTTTIGGNFSLTNVTLGTYTVLPSLSGSVFFPNSTTITISTQDISSPSFTVVPPLPVIAGQLVSADTGLGFPFGVVNIGNGTVQFSPSLDANGRFRITVSTVGSYTVIPTTSTLRAGYVFAPTQVLASVDANGIVSNSPSVFAARIPQYRLRGIVRSLASDQITGNAFIRVQTISTTGTVIGLQVTNALVSAGGGEYVLSVSSGTYNISTVYGSTIPPIYTVIPGNRLVSVTDANIDVGETIVSNRRYVVQGRIISTNGTLKIPRVGVPVRLEQFGTSLAITSATTDAQGNFTLLIDATRFTGIPLRFIVTLPGFTLRYNSANTNNELALEGLRDDFTFSEDIVAVPFPPQEFPVSLSIFYPNRIAVQAPITAIVTNASTTFTTFREIPLTLSADGKYTLAGVTTGVFRISLRSPNLVFSPSLVEVFMPRDAGVQITFQVTFAPMLASGRVQTILGKPVSGVQIRAGGSANGVAVTDANGQYSLSVTGQYPESRWFIFPALQDTIFYPSSRLIVSNSNTFVLNNMDFRATSTTSTLPLSTIRGKITIIGDDGREQGLGRVVLSDGTRAAQTDGNGEYIIRDVPNGTYTITPSLEGYAFTPGTLSASIVGGNNTQNQNFVARFRPDNIPPVVRTPLNDIPVIASVTTPIPLGSVFSDANNDTLLLATTVEDPTLLRTRIRNNTLLIDALSEGNTMINVIANDNRGGTTTASFRVTVSRPFATPTQFVRTKGNVNTNINAAIVIETQSVLALAGIPPGSSDGKNSSSLTAFSGELGAFNSKCECVGSIVWTGSNAVLPVWGKDDANDIPGMQPSEPIHIRFIDNIERRSRRASVMYFYNVRPGLWPIDQATITSIPSLEDDECKPVQTTMVSTHIEQNFFEARVTPNPASGKAFLSYTLPNAGMVTVELWNMLGQHASTLSSGYQASGEHRLDIAFDDLPSGMYVCRIQSSENAFSARNLSTIRISVIR